MIKRHTWTPPLEPLRGPEYRERQRAFLEHVSEVLEDYEAWRATVPDDALSPGL